LVPFQQGDGKLDGASVAGECEGMPREGAQTVEVVLDDRANDDEFDGLITADGNVAEAASNQR
jgi:hypothetical protein